jgi:ribA/ribD-fused uncharacterized protein
LQLAFSHRFERDNRRTAAKAKLSGGGARFFAPGGMEQTVRIEPTLGFTSEHALYPSWQLKEGAPMKYDRANLEAKFRSKEKLNFVFFWGHQPTGDGSVGVSCFSQWWGSPFNVGGHTFSTAEHWMMASKAQVFGDQDTFVRILAAKSPREVKALGRIVSGFDEEIWCRHRYQIVLAGTRSKFDQNSDLAAFLLSTGDKVIAEASPVDKIWGIGLTQKDERAHNPLEWQGDNLLGFALMETRDALKGGAASAV